MNGYFKKGGLVHKINLGWTATAWCKPARIGSMIITNEPVTCKKCMALLPQPNTKKEN